MPSKLEVAITSLDVLVPIAEAVPFLGAPVKGSREATKKILKYAQGVRNNKDVTRDLVDQAALLAQTIANAIESVRDSSPKLCALSDHVAEVFKMLERVASFQEERTKQSRMDALFRKQEDGGKIERLKNDLQATLHRFNTAAQIRTEAVVQNMVSDADKAMIYDILSPVSKARFDARDSPDGCLPNTRIVLLRDIKDWIEAPTTKLSVFWLSGMAGTGKTTIAKTLCDQWSEVKLLTSSFFVSRQDPDRRDPFRIIQTISYDLAQIHPNLFEEIYRILKDKRVIMDRPMDEQIDTLIVKPISHFLDKSPTTRPLVIVMDALDECDGSSDLKRMLELLMRLLADFPIKLFLTSRNEQHIRKVFGNVPHGGCCLHDLELNVVAADVRRFFDVRLGEVARRRKMTNKDWPSNTDLDRVTELAGYFFVYAATVVRYISDDLFTPEEQLDDVLSIYVPTSTEPKRGLDQLDQLYSHVLEKTTKNNDGQLEPRSVERVRDLLAILISARTPSLSVQALAGFTNLDESQTHPLCQRMSAFLRISESEDHQGLRHISFFHPSFPDYLLDSTRCGTFSIDDTLAHQKLADKCLQIMNEGLRKDICDIRDPSLRNDEVADLDDRLAQSVSPQLRYACRFWSSHIVLSSSQLPKDVLDRLDFFCRKHLLHWVEVLSLINEVSILRREVLSLSTRLEAQSSLAHALLDDIDRTVVTYGKIISDRALQIYHTAAAMMPFCELRNELEDSGSEDLVDIPCSFSRSQGWEPRIYMLQHSDIIDLVTFSPDGKKILSVSGYGLWLWDRISGTLLHRLRGHTGLVGSAAFSPNSKTIVSVSDDSTVRVWDATAGTETHTLTGHTGWVNCVAFSPDGKTIVSGSRDHTARAWDATTGTESHTLTGHTGWVISLAFSPDSKMIVSGSYDNTVRVWDATTGKVNHTSTGHTGWINCVAFSPDGKTIVSGSRDHTARVWDATTGTESHNLTGHTGWVMSLAFSPDSKTIVSGSHDNTVRLWDATTGTERHTLTGHFDWVNCVAFSPDSKSIVSGSSDCTVGVWDATTGTKKHTLFGYTHLVTSVAFSPDSETIVSGSQDCTVRVWDATSGMESHTSAGHTHSISSVAFSPDNKTIISGSFDCKVRVWDATMNAKSRILTGHMSWVYCVAFSPDSKMIVSGSHDHTARVWDATTCTEIHTLTGHSDSVKCVAFSPNSKSIVSGSDDHTVRVWDATTGTERHTLTGHTDFVRCVAFSTDSKTIVSDSNDRTIRVWDATTGASLDSAMVHQQVMTSPAPSEQHDEIGPVFKIDEEGWIWRGGVSTPWQRMCWLPSERQGQTLAYSGQKICIGTERGAITILNFSHVGV